MRNGRRILSTSITKYLRYKNKLSWDIYENKSAFLFPLYNLEYASVQDTTESKEKPARVPGTCGFSPQSKTWEETSIYSETGSFRFTVETKDAVPIDQAAREIKLFLKDKDDRIARQWSLVKLKDFIVTQLKNDGYDSSFLSRENLAKAKQAFGPMLRELGKKTPRMKMKPDAVREVKTEEMKPQFFSESSIKENSYLFYTEEV